MFLIAKIVRGRRLLHELEQEEKEKERERERERENQNRKPHRADSTSTGSSSGKPEKPALRGPNKENLGEKGKKKSVQLVDNLNKASTSDVSNQKL